MNSSTQALRQSAAELLAYAVCDLFPGALLVNSSTSDVSFFYDFIISQPVDERAIPLIEERMRNFAKQQIPIRTLDMMRENAIDLLNHHKQPLKAEKVAQSEENIVQIFQMGSFYDEAQAPFLKNSEEISAFKVMSLELIPPTASGLDEKITRIRGTAFQDVYHLKRFLKRAEQAKKRDHRTLGPDMNLFKYLGDEQDGSWILHPKGIALREMLFDCTRCTPTYKQKIPLLTPNISSSSIINQSIQKAYADDIDSNEITPSLFAALTFRSQSLTNSDMPITFQEFPTLEFEGPTGDATGLFESSTYSIDLTHIFCTAQQIEAELISCLQFINKIIKIFGFEHHWYLRVQGLGRKGNKSSWKKGIDSLKRALEVCQIDYTLDDQKPMRYGPRAEIGIIDALGREWAGPFIGIDVIHPDFLGLRYQEDENYKVTPVMIVQSLFGPIERFIALLAEHYAGDFPLWLAPEQVRVIPLAKNITAYADKVSASLKQAGFRSEVDRSSGQLGEKVHLAEMEKIPHIVIVGENEEKKNVIALRSDNNRHKKISVAVEQFIEQLKQESSSNTLLHKVIANSLQ